MTRVSRITVVLSLLLLLVLTACVQERSSEDVLSEPVIGEPTGESVFGEPTADGVEDTQAEGTGEEAVPPDSDAGVETTPDGTGEEGGIASGGGIGQEGQAEGEGEATMPSTPAPGEGENAEVTSQQPAPQETVVSIGAAEVPAEATAEAQAGGEVQAEAQAEPQAEASAQVDQPPGTESYTVQAGDTLFSIATRFNTTVEELRRLNNMDTNFITVGEQLIVPSATAPPAEAAGQPALPTVHVVKGGEWIYSIARLYGVSPQAIIAANPGIGNPNLLYPGQELIIPAP